MKKIDTNDPETQPSCLDSRPSGAEPSHWGGLRETDS